MSSLRQPRHLWWVVLVACSTGTKVATHESGDVPTADGYTSTTTSTEVPLWNGTASLDAPGERAPLAFRLTTSDTQTPLTLTLTGGEHTLTLRFQAHEDRNTFPVLGLHPGTTYAASLQPEGFQAVALEPITTPELPERFPDVEVLTHRRGELEPGLTLLDVKSPNTPDDYVIALSADGHVVWYYEPPTAYGDFHWTDQGTLFGLSGPGAREVNVYGEQVAMWSNAPKESSDVAIEVGGLHHEWHHLPDGGFLGLTARTLEVDAYPTSYGEPNTLAPATLRDAVIVEVDEHGATRSHLALSEVFDTQRIGYDGLDLLNGGARDWVHANGVIDTPDGQWIVSARHQDALAKVSSDGDVSWILAPHVGWREAYRSDLLAPIGDDFEWPAHQHAPELQPDGTLVVFDNGRWRASPYDAADVETSITYTRVVAYRINEEAMTVEEAWSIPAPDGLYSPALGDADVQPNTGNVLFNLGFLDEHGGQLHPTKGWGRKAIRVVEVHPDAPGEVLWDVLLNSDFEEVPEGWKSYRSERVRSLYPSGWLQDD